MSSTLKIYAGVYLEIENDKGHKSRQTYVDSLGNPVGTRFNPHTGEQHQLVNVDKTITIYPDPCDFDVEGFSEYEFMPVDGFNDETTIWIPNVNKGFQLAYFDSDEERQCVDLNNVYALEFKERFCEYYNIYLHELGKKFNFRVKFGLITFYV